MKDFKLWIVALVLAVLATICVTLLLTRTPKSDVAPPPSTSLTLRTSRVLRYDYAQVLNVTLLFLEAQRSGKLPSDKRLAWRGDSSLDCRGERGEDLSGGYFIEGESSSRTLFEQSLAVLEIAWTLFRHEAALEHAGLLQRFREALKWGADFLMKGSEEGLSYDISSVDNSWTRPEEVTRSSLKISRVPRPHLIYTIAGLAGSAAAFKESNQSLSEAYAERAKWLFDDLRSNTSAKSDGVLDDQSVLDAYKILASAFLSTVDEDDKSKYHKIIDETTQHANFERTAKFSHLLAFTHDVLDSFSDPRECDAALMEAMEEERVQQNTPYKKLLTCLVRGETLVRLGLDEGSDFVRGTVRFVNHILGDSGRSFLTGFGHNPPQRPYHIASSCPDLPAPCGPTERSLNQPNPHVLPGGLVKGYRKDPYRDQRDRDYNNVDLFKNTRFMRTVAILLNLHLQKRLPEAAFNYTYSFVHTVDHRFEFV